MTLPASTHSFRIVAKKRVEDEPERYKLCPAYFLPPVSLLLEDFTEECRKAFPGVLDDDDYVMRGYDFKVLW